MAAESAPKHDASVQREELSAFLRSRRERISPADVTVARYPDDPETADLIAELRSSSAEFVALWDAHDVCARPTPCKTFTHPAVGPISVDCDVRDFFYVYERFVIYTAEPGSPSEVAMRLLSVIGTPAAGRTRLSRHLLTGD